MDQNFYTDEFERLIRQKADQYKMYPSDHVWKGVYRSIHGRRRWYLAGLTVALLGVGVFTADFVFNKSTPKITADEQQSIAAASQSNRSFLSFDQNNNFTRGSFRFVGISKQPLAQAENLSTVATSKELVARYFSGENNFFVPHTKVAPGKLLAISQHPEIPNNLQLPTSSNNENNIADASSESSGLEKVKQVNWLQEYAVYSLAPRKMKRLSFQLYLSPTVNYRKLSGKGSGYYPASEVQSIPIALSFNGNVDDYVNHKPAFGFELGSALQYRFSKHIRFKAGVQFNYSQYNIEAYSSHPERATIALSSNNYNADTILSFTSVRNMSGYSKQELSNQYFQLSFPVGVEVMLFGNERIQLDVAGSIQPTYLMNRNSYLITTDYKNYTQQPSLVRKWNINAGLETFIAYKTGSVRWQLGPQFRYQFLSSYIDTYPIKEYLMEYGFKIGVTKTLK